ncbi:hypothetical protein Tco_0502258 [Tanacetum coccineum]
MMVEIYQAFKGQPSSTPTDNVTLTLALTHILANVEGENATITVTEEPPSHTERETGDTTMAIPISSIHPTEVQPTHDQPITSIISHPESSHATPRIDKGKGIATESDEDPSKRLVPASTIICPDPDEPVRVEFMINGKTVYLTEQEIQEYWDKEEKMKKAVEEAKLLAMSRPEVIKLVQEEAEKIGLDPKKIASAKAGEKIKPEPITDVRIYPNTKPIVASVFRNSDKRNFDVHQPFRFSDFGITELDELVPEQASSQTSGRKRKHMELEPEVKVPGLECNRSLPKGVPFVNHMVIEEPEYGIFFIDVFGDQAFQRWDDIHKVGIDSLVSYLVMASMAKTEENARFSLKLRKMIAGHPDQDKLNSKKVKLEALGYHVE